ncbi:MAG: DUF4160 domain-containing protein [Lachnospiraceae bacterium]
MNSYEFYAKRIGMPVEIINFLFETFCIVEQRGIVGRINAIKFEIRTKEENHNLPHVHASYGEYEISIAIDNGDILAGSLPYKQVKIAKKWIEENKDMLNTTWKNIKIECEMPYTGTTLSLVSSNMGV